VREDLKQLHAITTKLRQERQHASIFFVPFEDPRLPDLVGQ
jgi:hypothetical protein